MIRAALREMRVVLRVVNEKRLPDGLASQIFRSCFHKKRIATVKERAKRPYKTRSQAITRRKMVARTVTSLIFSSFISFYPKSSAVAHKLGKSKYFSKSDVIFFSMNPSDSLGKNDIFPEETTLTECKWVIFFN